jgi:trimeric autotransporter adhesin
VPPVVSPATGVASLILAPDRSRVVYNIRHAGIVTETMAHIHRGAFGTNGPVIVNFPLGSSKTGSFTVTLEQVRDMEAGQLYVNVHSQTNPGGEIRGQIRPAGGCFDAVLNGANEVPANTSTARGAATVMLSPDGGDMTYALQHSGIVTETMAHIHRANSGVNGPVIFDLGVGAFKTGSITVTATQRQDLLDETYYFNVHSQTNPGGEIRGQIVPTSACYSAQLTGQEEIPSNTSTASGRAFFTLTAGGVVQYQITHSGIVTETMAHIHEGQIGQNGPVIVPFTVGAVKSGSITLTAAQQDAMVAGRYYVNIHSVAFPGGELRGQIVQAACQIHGPQVHVIR